MVGKHAVILCEYDETLKPSEITFDRMDVWVRILDLPLSWMNKHRGERLMGLIGEVKKMDVDKDGNASGPFLRACVAIEVSKPVQRGVLLKMKKTRHQCGLIYSMRSYPFSVHHVELWGTHIWSATNLSFEMKMGNCHMISNLRCLNQKRKICGAFRRLQRKLMVVDHCLPQNTGAGRRVYLAITALQRVEANWLSTRTRRSPDL